MRTPIRDSTSKPIAYIDTNGKNSRLFNNTGGKLVATYNSGTNSTYTSNGKLVGKGNLLQSQIKK